MLTSLIHTTQRHWAVPLSFLICAAFLYYAVGITPTYDDWYTLSSPNFDAQWHKYFMPYGSVWRPIDALMGYVSQDAAQFPLYNHIITVAAHLLSTLMVYALARRLFASGAACNFAALVFCVSPCMLATVFACDAINQALSQMFGLAAVAAFVFMRSRWRYALWAVLVWAAALAKDNGIAWAVVPPVLALYTERTPMRTLCRRLAFGVAIATAYAAVRLSLPYTVIPNPEYSTFSLVKKLREVAMLMAYSFVPVDWMSVFCVEARQIASLLITIFCTFWLWAALLPGALRALRSRNMWVLAACFVIVLSPNLLITLSMMNAYAGLAFAALLMGLFLQEAQPSPKKLRDTMFCFVAAVLITDSNHIFEAQNSAQEGIIMAHKANEECMGHKPGDTVFSVTVEETERKYSSFHVLPSDAFSNGQAVLWVNNYRWPRQIHEEYVPAGERAKAVKMAADAVGKGGYAYAFVVEHNWVQVLKSAERQAADTAGPDTVDALKAAVTEAARRR